MCSPSETVNIVLLKLTNNGSTDFVTRAKKYGQPILDSGNYRHGFAVTERTKIPPGIYAIIVSTFHPGKLGNFVMRVAHSSMTGIVVDRIQ